MRALMLIQLDLREAADAELRSAAPRVPANLQPLLLTIAERGVQGGTGNRPAS
jgi:hypothetical protein